MSKPTFTPEGVQRLVNRYIHHLANNNIYTRVNKSIKNKPLVIIFSFFYDIWFGSVEPFNVFSDIVEIPEFVEGGTFFFSAKAGNRSPKAYCPISVFDIFSSPH